MASDSGDGKSPTGTEAGDSPGEEGQLCSVALKDIFLSCDKHNVGSAQAQRLIEFVTPFLSNNVMELMCLKNCLDPNNDNPLITEEQFFHKMQVWISKIKTMNVSPEKRRNFEAVSFNQFSSHENGPSTQFLKNSAESGMLNLSGTSSTSIGNAFQEIASLQEATHELEHQNRKLQEELALIKSQLAASEEQNELLQSDLRKINNKLLAEQHLNEQLQLERKDNEELRECSQGLTKKIELLEKSFSCVERENGNIRQKLELLEQENQKLEDKLEQAKNKEMEKEKAIIKMRTEHDFKEAVIASLEKALLEMQEKLKENQQTIEHHIEINEGLKVEKVTLEKLLRGQLSQSYIIPSTPPNPLTSGSSDIELKAATADSPLKNDSVSSIFLHDTSSEDDLFSKVPLTESSVATQHSLLYELSQVKKENEVNNNSKNILDQIQQENDDLKKRLDICIEELNEFKKELDLVKLTETETKKENANLRNEVKLLIQEKLDLKCKSENSSSYVLKLEEKLKNAKHEEMLAIEIKEVNEQMDILNKTILDIEEKNKSLIEELNKLKHSLQLKECASENLEYEHLSLMDAFDVVKKEYDELKKKTPEKENCAEKLNEAVREKENHIKILESEMDILKNKLNENTKISKENQNSLSEEIGELKITIAKKEEIIWELKRLIHNLSTQLDNDKQTEEMQSNKICKCNKLIEEKETAIKHLEKVIDSLNTQIKNSKVNGQLIEQLQKELDNTRKIQLQLEKQITQKDTNEKNLENEIDKLKKFLKDNEKSITYLTTFSNNLNQQISIKEDVEMMLRREVNKLDQILNEKEDAIKYIEVEISQTKQLLSIKDALIDQLKNHNSKIATEFEDVIKEKNENIEDFKNKIQNLNKLNEEKDIQLNAVNAQIEELQMSIEKKDQSMCELSDYNAHLEESILLEKKKEIELEENISDLMKTVQNKDDIVQNFEVLVNDLQIKLNDAKISFEESEKIHEKDVLQLKDDIEKKDMIIKDLELLTRNLQGHLNELTDAKKKYEEQELSLRQLEMLNRQLNEKIVSEATKFSKSQDELNQLKSDILDREEKNKKFKHDIDFLKSELRQKEELIQKFEDNDQKTRNVLHEKEDYIQQLNSLNSDLMEKISIVNNLEDYNRELNIQLTEKEGTINSLKCSVDALNVQIETMKTQLYTNKVIFETQIKSLQEELKNRENTTEKLRNDLSSKIKSLKDESHSLNSVLKMQKTSLENYELQVCEMSKSLEAKNSHLDSLSHDLNQLRESSEEKDVSFAYLQKDFKELENRYQQKITEVEELTTLLLAKEKTIEKLKEKNHQYHISLKENEEIVNRLETETAQLNEQLTILSKNSDTQDYKSPKSGKCSYDRLNIKIEKLQEKNDSLEQQLEEERKNSQRVLNENDELSKKISKLNETYFDLKKELEQLKNTNDAALSRESMDSPSGDVTSQHSIYRGTANTLASNKKNEVDQSISEIIPSLKTVLPMLSLYREKTPAEKLMVREKFETLVLALTVDASTIVDRVERQKGRLLSMEDSVATEVAKLLDLLDELKGQNQDPFVANCIILCIEQVSVVTNVASKTVMTAMMAGSLQQEHNFIHSMCTLINYVSDVQRDLDSATIQLSGLSRSIKFQSRNLFEEIKDVLLFEDRNIDSGNDIVTRNQGQTSFGKRLIERCHKMFKSNVFHLFYRLCAATIFIYVVTVIIVTCLGDDDLCSPFIKVSYGHGPRPM